MSGDLLMLTQDEFRSIVQNELRDALNLARPNDPTGNKHLASQYASSALNIARITFRDNQKIEEKNLPASVLPTSA